MGTTLADSEVPKEVRLFLEYYELFGERSGFSLPTNAYVASQIARNLAIVQSPLLRARSLRYAFAVYRLVELGVSPYLLAEFAELHGKRSSPLMQWFRVKRALCLSASSCGLREFFL